MKLTAKQEAQKARDCKVNYGRGVKLVGQAQSPFSLVPERMQGVLDKERERLWVDEEVIEAMPSWAPVMAPVVARVIRKAHDEVKEFMLSVSRSQKGAIVKSLVKAVLREAKGLDRQIVEEVTWRHLFDLLKDQGVVNRGRIEKMVEV